MQVNTHAFLKGCYFPNGSCCEMRNAQILIKTLFLPLTGKLCKLDDYFLDYLSKKAVNQKTN